MKHETKKSIGIQDIAAKLNISASTVSRALNDHPRISKSTKARVLNAALKMGYNPSVPGLMAPEQNRVIGVAVPAINDFYFGEIIKGITAVLNKNNYTAVVWQTEKRSADAAQILKICQKLNLDGIILPVEGECHPFEHLDVLAKRNFPTVIVNRTMENPPFTCVVPDVFQGVYEMTEHLLHSGCAHPVLIAEKENGMFRQMIIDAFENALKDNNPETKNAVITVNADKKEIYNTLTGLFKKDVVPDALIAASPLLTVTVSDFLKNHNIKIPDDILFAGVGKDRYTPFLTPSVSTLVIPAKSLGETAANELLQQINDIDYSFQTVIKPVKFIIKNSTLKIK